MPAPATKVPTASARSVTYAAYFSFIPIGIATVLLGPLLPSLSARWSLTYSQAGALFTAQYVASTCAVAISGVLSSRRGFLFPIKVGLVLMALGLAFLFTGPKLLGILCIGAYGAGLGIAVPAANLMVAVVNPARRSAALNLLNFFWSAGAVSCPFLVAAAARAHQIVTTLSGVAVFSLIIAAGIALLPVRTMDSSAGGDNGPLFPLIRQQWAPFFVLAALFLTYVGTENAFGGWIASYSKSLGSIAPALALMSPSFFYAMLMIGRWIAPVLLRRISEIRIAQIGLLLALLGSSALILSHGFRGVVASACIAGMGLSSVYPISIALLSRQFESARIGSIMFTLSNIGGGLLPWVVGVISDRFGAINAGLYVPILGCAAMFLLFVLGTSQETPSLQVVS